MSTNLNFIFIIGIILTNIYIIKNEYYKRKIPNQLLLLLLGFNISFVLSSSTHIYLIPSLIKISIIIIGIITMFYFKIWNPSYLKYIFISSIFFLGVGEITYISNIFFLIFLFIVFHFFNYYLRILFNYKRLKSYLGAFKKQTTGNINNWLAKNRENVIFKIATTILGFLAVFVLIRLFRIYIQGEMTDYIFVFEINNITINTLVFIFIGLFILTAVLHTMYSRYLFSNYKYLSILIAITISIIAYEFIYDYAFISKYLYKILTFLLILFGFLRILLNMSKYLFFDHDSEIIDYKELKAGHIIDKKLISTYLVGQKSLEKDDVKNFIKQINNPINSKDCSKLQSLIEKNDNYQKELELKAPPNIIRVYKTFIFSPFIFGSFLITFFVKKNMLIIILYQIYKLTMGLGN